MSNEIFEDQQQISEDKLLVLSGLCRKYKDLEAQIEAKEQELKSLNEMYTEVSRVSIPTLLNEAGLSEVRLSSGEKVEIKDQLKASVADKNYLQAYRNMVEAEGDKEKIDSLFKEEAIISQVNDEILDALIEKGIEYEVKRSIHPQTLKKYCQERLDNGLSIPEGISVFQYQETKIK